MKPTASSAAPRAEEAFRPTLDFRCYVAEALGSAILVFAGCGAAIISTSTHAFGHAAVALAFGLIVTFLVATFGTISGAHVNPAVTLAFWSVRRFPGRYVVPYIVAQCLGAIGGAFALRVFFGVDDGLGYTIPSLDAGRAFGVEFVFSAILALVIFAVATDERVPRMIAPFVLGATVFVCALVAGPVTGGSFNPSRSLGPSVAGNAWTSHWLYWIAPISGMMLAARLYDYLRGTQAPDVSPRGVPTGLEGPI